MLSLWDTLSRWDRTVPPSIFDVTLAFETWRSVSESQIRQNPNSGCCRRQKSMPDWMRSLCDSVHAYSSSYGEGGMLAALVIIGGLLRGYISPVHGIQLPGRRALETFFLELIPKPFELMLSGDWEQRICESMAFVLGQCVPWMVLPAQHTAEGANIVLSFGILVRFLIESPLSFNVNAALSVLDVQLSASAAEAETLKQLDAAVANRIATTTNPLWAEIPRISNAAALLVRGIPAAEVVSATEKIRRFAWDLFITWEHCPLSAMREEPLDANQRSIMRQMWHMFKTTLFSVTVVFSGICDEWFFVDGRERALSEPDVAFLLIRDILIAYSHLHFVTVKFGTAGFSAYHQVVDSLVSSISSLGERQIWHAGEVAEMWASTRPPHFEREDTDLSRTRLLFYLNMSEKLAFLLPNDVLEKDILPLVAPYLRARVAFPLHFEAAHAVVLALLITEKPVAAEFAMYYADLILEEFPSTFTTEQLRAAYGAAVQAASGMDDALAEELINRLVRRIDGQNPTLPLPSSVLPDKMPNTLDPKSGLIAALLDQVRTANVNLLPWLFDRIHRVVRSTPSASQALHILYENVSVGVDSMRRADLVRFYLNLASEIGVSGVDFS